MYERIRMGRNGEFGTDTVDLVCEEVQKSICKSSGIRLIWKRGWWISVEDRIKSFPESTRIISGIRNEARQESGFGFGDERTHCFALGTEA